MKDQEYRLVLKRFDAGSVEPSLEVTEAEGVSEEEAQKEAEDMAYQIAVEGEKDALYKLEIYAEKDTGEELHNSINAARIID
jgi:hypothetical protein